jgi:hypothetical protein
MGCSFPQLGWIGRDVAVVGLSLENYFYAADVHCLSVLFSGLELVCSNVYFFDFYVGQESVSDNFCDVDC